MTIPSPAAPLRTAVLQAAGSGDAIGLARAMEAFAASGHGPLDLDHWPTPRDFSFDPRAWAMGGMLLIDQMKPASPDNQIRSTPLCEAARRDHAECVELLLSLGADPNAASDGHWPALHIAAGQGFTKTLEVLVRCPATDLNLRNIDGLSALCVAIGRSAAPAAEALLAAGADPWAADFDGMDCFAQAASVASVDCMRSIATRYSQSKRSLFANDIGRSEGNLLTDAIESVVGDPMGAVQYLISLGARLPAVLPADFADSTRPGRLGHQAASFAKEWTDAMNLRASLAEAMPQGSGVPRPASL